LLASCWHRTGGTSPPDHQRDSDYVPVASTRRVHCEFRFDSLPIFLQKIKKLWKLSARLCACVSRVCVGAAAGVCVWQCYQVLGGLPSWHIDCLRQFAPDIDTIRSEYIFNGLLLKTTVSINYELLKLNN